MNNSESSATGKIPTAASVTLQLRGYLTPSLNRLLGQHWSAIQKEKVSAKIALLFALRDGQSVCSTPTILQEAANHLLTNSATRNLSQTMTREASKLSSGKSKSRRKRKK
jgi:hypothetical protein